MANIYEYYGILNFDYTSSLQWNTTRVESNGDVNCLRFSTLVVKRGFMLVIKMVERFARDLHSILQIICRKWVREFC